FGWPNTYTNIHVPGSNNPHIFWNDGALQVTDALSFLTGKYGYADILTVASTNGGTSFGSPVRVNTNVEPLPNGRGTDQYQPAVAIDKNVLEVHGWNRPPISPVQPCGFADKQTPMPVG